MKRMKYKAGCSGVTNKVKTVNYSKTPFNE